jgi:hypothetical protein
MDDGNPSHWFRTIFRAILYANFLLFALFVVPMTHHWVDEAFLALGRINLEDVVGRSMQVWVVASTMMATVLFGAMYWKHRKEASSMAFRFEGMLLLTWWVTLVGICVYAFSLGMGG